MQTTIAGHEFDMTADDVRRLASQLDPEASLASTVPTSTRTRRGRSSFDSFPVQRRGRAHSGAALDSGPLGGAESRALAPYVGRWIAQDGLEILYDAGSPEEVARWLLRHRRRARVWRVPGTPAEVGSAASAP